MGRLFTATSLLLLTAACGGGERAEPGDRDSGPPPDAGRCRDGDIVCVGREAHVCMSGALSLQEACGDDRVCALGLGCRSCQPGRPFCVGREVHTCDDTGEGSTVDTTCPADQACRQGACVNACDAARDDRSNIGCEYYAVDLDNEWGEILGIMLDAAGEQFAVVLANPSDVEVTARVLRNDAAVGAAPLEVEVGRWMVPPEGLVRIDLPAREVDGSVRAMNDGPGTFLSSQAYRIVTNFPVVAYQFNPIIQSASNDASLLIPTSGLDGRYRVIGWPTANPISGPFMVPGIPDHSYVTIVGTQPNTQVRVTLGGPIVGGGGIAAAGAGEVVEATLGPYDVLNLESDGIPGDMTGTLVDATQPVAVFSGGERGIAPLSESVEAHPDGPPMRLCCTEHLEEQVFPTSAWGKGFVVTRSPVRTDHPTWREPDIYRVMADQDGTDIATNLPAPNDRFTLAAGEWVELSTDRSFTVATSRPVSIQQILVSQEWLISWKPGHGGDPSMILFPPYEQYRESYIFLAPETFSANYVVVSTPEGTEVRLDGRDINADEFMSICEYEDAGTIDDTLYTTVTCPIDGGVHRVDATRPVGIMVYGYYAVGSYGYAGGSSLTRINVI